MIEHLTHLLREAISVTEELQSALSKKACAARAAEELRCRRQRERLFGSNLFADPAWDMLLDLFVAEETGKSTAISCLCAVCGVPATTALRYLSALQEAGHVFRVEDTQDRRRILIRLTDDARSKMIAYLQPDRRFGAASANPGSNAPAEPRRWS